MAPPSITPHALLTPRQSEILEFIRNALTEGCAAHARRDRARLRLPLAERRRAAPAGAAEEGADGNRVYPQEVTAQVLSLPGIRDAVVIGVPRPDGQTALVGFLVPATPGEPTVGTIRTLLNGRLPAYMVPKEFVFVDRIPRTATGKADPHTLVATYAAGAAHP